MLIRKIFKLTYPCALGMVTINLSNKGFQNTIYYTTNYEFSQVNKKSNLQSEVRGNKNFDVATRASESDSELSSEEEQSADLNAVNPLAKKSIEDIYKENELVQSEPLRLISKEDSNYPMIKTIYGRIVSVNSFLNQNKLKDCKTIHYVNDQSSIKHIIGLLKADAKCIVIFDPTTHYANMFATYNGIKRKLLKDIYGSAKNPKNPFQKCKTNKEIFDLHRRILIQQKYFLARICLFIGYDGNIRIKGDQKTSLPSSITLKMLLERMNKSEEQSSYFKNEFLVPVSYWLGLNSSDEWEKKGISIDVLGGAKIYPHYSVWPPTSQHYLTILDEYIDKKKNYLKSRKNTLDIGCGTGVLSLVLNKKCEGIKDIYAVDSNKKAVECAKINLQIFGANEIVQVEQLDFVDAVNSNKIDTFLTEKSMPTKYELLISNPPWITASFLDSEHELDNGIYDPKGGFVRAILKFAGIHLTTQSILTKKGLLLLIYSDISEVMGLQSPGSIQDICTKNNLVISNTYSKPFYPPNYVKKEGIDPLHRFKKMSKLILYEITRP